MNPSARITRRIFKADFLENKDSNDEILFFIFDLFFHMYTITNSAGFDVTKFFDKLSNPSARITRRIFKADFLENKDSNDEILFFIFDLFYHMGYPVYFVCSKLLPCEYRSVRSLIMARVH